MPMACNHHHVVLGGSLTCDLALRILSEASVQHSIGDLVAELVWVALVHRLRGKQKGALHLGFLLGWLCHEYGSNAGREIMQN